MLCENTILRVPICYWVDIRKPSDSPCFPVPPLSSAASEPVHRDDHPQKDNADAIL